MMLGVNYAFADNDSTHTEDAVITQLFKKNHQRYRRTGRGRMIATGETYKSYHIVFAMSDGRTKEQQLTARQYSGLHVGDTYRVNVSDGFLGFPVIKR